MVSLIQKLLDALTPKTPAAMKTAQYTLGSIAVVGAVLSLVISYNFSSWRAFILCIWAILPPMYFWIEYYCFYDHVVPLEQFKYGQEVSRNIWAGVLAVLIALKLTDDGQSSTGAQSNPKTSVSQTAQIHFSPTPAPVTLLLPSATPTPASASAPAAAPTSVSVSALPQIAPAPSNQAPTSLPK